MDTSAGGLSFKNMFSITAELGACAAGPDRKCHSVLFQGGLRGSPPYVSP